MTDLMAVLQGKEPPGVYRLVAAIDLNQLRSLSQQYDFQLFYIDGQNISSKADFLREFAQVLQFPDYFGQNWDAFEDCITDLSWLSGDRYIVLYDHSEHFAEKDPAEWSTALEILQCAIESWAETENSLSVLIRGNSPDLAELETISDAKNG